MWTARYTRCVAVHANRGVEREKQRIEVIRSTLKTFAPPAQPSLGPRKGSWILRDNLALRARLYVAV